MELTQLEKGLKTTTFFIVILLSTGPVIAQEKPGLEDFLKQANIAATEAYNAAVEAVKYSRLAKGTYEKEQIDKFIQQANDQLQLAQAKAELASKLALHIEVENRLRAENPGLIASDTSTTTQPALTGLPDALKIATKAANVEIEKAKDALDEAEVFKRSGLSTDILTGFGFGPAYFIVNYDREILDDVNDVRLRKDNRIAVSSTKSDSYLGLEFHYGFSFGIRCRNGYSKKKPPCEDADIWKETSGHTVSPYLGLFDIEDGFNGYSFGILYGYWHGDNAYQKKKALNFAVGRLLHRNRLILAKGISEGDAQINEFELVDYTRKKDVYGYSILISAELGF